MVEILLRERLVSKSTTRCGVQCKLFAYTNVVTILILCVHSNRGLWRCERWTAIILVSKSRKMTLTLQELALLVKLFNQNRDSVTKALRKFRSLKWLRKCPVTSQELANMIRNLKQREHWYFSGKGRKCGAALIVDDVAQVEKERS